MPTSEEERESLSLSYQMWVILIKSSHSLHDVKSVCRWWWWDQYLVNLRLPVICIPSSLISNESIRFCSVEDTQTVVVVVMKILWWCTGTVCYAVTFVWRQREECITFKLVYLRLVSWRDSLFFSLWLHHSFNHQSYSLSLSISLSKHSTAEGLTFLEWKEEESGEIQLQAGGIKETPEEEGVEKKKAISLWNEGTEGRSEQKKET